MHNISGLIYLVSADLKTLSVAVMI